MTMTTYLNPEDLRAERDALLAANPWAVDWYWTPCPPDECSCCYRTDLYDGDWSRDEAADRLHSIGWLLKEGQWK